MSERITFKVTDYIERDLVWEDGECNKLGVDFEYYQLKTAPRRKSSINAVTPTYFS